MLYLESYTATAAHQSPPRRYDISLVTWPAVKVHLSFPRSHNNSQAHLIVKNSSCHGFPRQENQPPTTVPFAAHASFPCHRSRLQGAHGSTDEPSPAPPAASATGGGAVPIGSATLICVFYMFLAAVYVGYVGMKSWTDVIIWEYFMFATTGHACYYYRSIMIMIVNYDMIIVEACAYSQNWLISTNY